MADRKPRELSPEEQRGAATALMLREQPHFLPPEVTLFFDDATSDERTVLGIDGPEGLIAAGLLCHLAWHPPDDRLLWVLVAGSARAQGLGSGLHDALLDRVPPTVTRLRTTTFDDDAASGEVAEHWGFRRLQLSIRSSVEVSTAADPVLPPDVTVETTDGLDLPDREAVEAMLDASQTNPERDTGSVMTLADFGHQQEGDRLLLGVLRVDGSPAAICAAMHSGPEGYIGYTGVDPAHRGRNLGDLLKRAVHAEAGRRGLRRLAAENEQGNAGIRRVNARLGYEVEFGAWRWARDL